MNCWKNMLVEEMEKYGETIADIISNTMTEEQMNEVFDDGYGIAYGCSFTVWTEKSVYFPVCYDGAEWVGRVARNWLVISFERLTRQVQKSRQCIQLLKLSAMRRQLLLNNYYRAQ